MQTVIVDFDGVIHSSESRWSGADVILDPPVPGMRQAIALVRAAGYRVVVASTRCYQSGGIAAIKRWLERHEIVVDDVTGEKPPAIVTIDDRALCFDPAKHLDAPDAIAEEVS
jgi:beta-phosphoglucomutase-like phosphatase (HAD superfamily)